jgi:hypothetical protein
VLDALLSRLHSGAYQLCNVYYQKERDRRVEDKLRRASTLLQDGRLAECRELLDRMDPDSQAVPTYRQVYLMLDAAIILSAMPGAAAASSALDNIERAVRLTQPHIDLKNMRRTLLSQNEARALALMVPALLYAGRPLDAIMFG